MAKKMPDITGMKFGMLTAISFAGRLKRGNAHTLAWECLCDCGGTKVAGRPELLSGKVVSCGCNHGRPTHNMSKRPEYNSYSAMMRRCHVETDKDYKRYGGKGIKVCDRWRFGEGGISGMECFFADMGSKPSSIHTLDRIKNSVGYTPDNCRWATPTKQARNRSTNYFSDGRDVKAFVEANGVKYSTFRQRVSKGWPVELAATHPIRQPRNPEALSEKRRRQAFRRERLTGRFAQ